MARHWVRLWVEVWRPVKGGVTRLRWCAARELGNSKTYSTRLGVRLSCRPLALPTTGIGAIIVNLTFLGGTSV